MVCCDGKMKLTRLADRSVVHRSQVSSLVSKYFFMV